MHTKIGELQRKDELEIENGKRDGRKGEKVQQNRYLKKTQVTKRRKVEENEGQRVIRSG